MNRLKKSAVYVLCVLITLGLFSSCAKKGETAKEKRKMNAYIDIKDSYTLEIIRFLTDEFKKQSNDVEINFNNPLGGKKMDEDIVKGDMDVIFISRGKMLELSKKGLLNDMAEFYSKNKMDEKYYNILGSYGRIGDKYYGVGLFPYSIEIFYNKDAFSKLKMSTPQNLKDLIPILKKLNTLKIKVPIQLNEGMDIKNAVTAVIFSNTVNMIKLEDAYDRGKESYSSLNVQQVFDTINTLVKQGVLMEETLEVAGEGTVGRLINGDIPIMISISKISSEIKDNPSIEVLKDYNLSKKSSVPVIVNCVLSVPANSKNEEVVNEFLEFAYSEKTQKKLAEKGLITANKAVNNAVFKSGVSSAISKHLEEADSNSIYYEYNFPQKFQAYFETAIGKVFKGKYTGTEWKDIIQQVYK